MTVKRRTKRLNDDDTAHSVEVKKRNGQSSKKQQSTFSFVALVFVALAAAAVHLGHHHSKRDQVMSALRFVCHAEGGFCHDGLQGFQRSHRAKQTISKGTLLLRIPRRVQIWDLDALRALDLKAIIRNDITGRPLDGGAFLAFYLWERFVHKADENDPLLSYYHSFPTDLSYHPIFWSDTQLQQRLRPHSHAYAVARAYRDMVMSEYKALAKLQPDLPLETYQGFRVLVLSRSFGTGPPGRDEAKETTPLDEELLSYNQTLGVDLTLGCRAMVPILDMYNHHVLPNVAWRYESGAFLVTASRQINTNQLIYDSYGTYTDSHLFAKFGFQNGDGSTRTDASIAAMHRLMNVGLQQQFSYLPSKPVEQVTMMETQKMNLARYLQFDDGYTECIASDPNSTPYQLKQVKLQHLMRLAHDPKRWVVSIPPRNPKARPHDELPDRVPSFDMKALPGFDASKVISTCRLIVLTEDDFDGSALSVLQDYLASERDGILIEKQSDNLEYRALLCLARLSGLVLHRFEIPSEKAVETFADSVKAEPHSPLWTTHHVVVGEVQTLEVLTKVAAAGAHQYAAKISGELPTIRRLPCDWSDTKRLAERTRVI